MPCASAGDWTPGDQLAEMTVDDAPLGAEGRQDFGRFPHPHPRGRPEGACAHPASGRTGPLDAGKSAAGHVQDAAVPDAGSGRKVDVDVGDEVQEGQALCTIEAMKMENILRAEKKGVVTRSTRLRATAWPLMT